MFGRVDLCDFVLDHPTISRFHAGMLFVFTDSLLYFNVMRKQVNTCYEMFFSFSLCLLYYAKLYSQILIH